MWMLQLTFVLTVLGIINCFQWAAAILAKQNGRSFWLWYFIAQFLPGISMIVLLYLWNADNNTKTINNHE